SRPLGDGDVLWNLEAEQKRRRRALKEPFPVIRRGELVEREVATHDRERGRIIGKTLRLELLLRELAAREIQLRPVKAAEPAVVFPRARAEVDALLRQRAQLRSQPRRLRRKAFSGVEERK